MKTHESAENYLETILQIYRKKGSVRSVDIANEMGFSKPSVSIAMKKLREQEYIAIDRYGHITLSPLGLKRAENILERHMILTRWLILLGVDEKIAAEDACRIEHVISQESFDAVKVHIQAKK